MLAPTTRTTPRKLFALAGACLALLAACLPAPAQGTNDPAPATTPAPIERPRFDTFWLVETWPEVLQARNGVDWAAQFNLTQMPVRRDIWIIFEQQFLHDLMKEGLGESTRTGWRDRMARMLAREFDRLNIPQDATGFGCLDIEFATAYWGDRTGGPGLYMEAEGHAKAQYDKWFRHITTERPELFRDKSGVEGEAILAATYEAQFKFMMLASIEEARKLRPGIKWGFFAYPVQCDNGYLLPEPNRFKAMNDSLQWLYDASDALFPTLYTWKRSLPEGSTITTPQYQNTAQQDADHIRSTVIESRRKAGNDKPVVPLVMLNYPWSMPEFGDKPLNEANLKNCLEIPKAAGADGLAIWGTLRTRADLEKDQATWDQRAVPLLRPLISTTPAPREPAAPARGVQAPATNPTSYDNAMLVLPPPPNARPKHSRPIIVQAPTTTSPRTSPSTSGSASSRLRGTQRQAATRSQPTTAPTTTAGTPKAPAPTTTTSASNPSRGNAGTPSGSGSSRTVRTTRRTTGGGLAALPQN